MSLLRVTFWVAVVYGVFCVGIFLMQDRMIYQPWRELSASPSRVGLAFENVDFEASDGVPLHGWFIPADKPGGKVLLFFHGNAGNISHRIESINIFHELGLDVFIFDYRGYGKSGGKPSEEGLYRDGIAAMGYLADRGFSPDDIVIFERSLRNAVAARVSLFTPPHALILESSFTSLAEMASRVVRLFPVRLLLRSEYPTEENLGQVSCPVLVIHSPEDEIIPFSQGIRLYETAPEPKTFLQISGDHNGGFLLSGETYLRGLEDFLFSLDQMQQ